MQIKKFIVSSFLLLVYSLGFAHSLIPHCHEVGESHAAHSEIEHHHHIHLKEHHTVHSHHKYVSHRNHLDEDLYDFLICVLSDMEHHGNDNEFVHLFPQKQIRITGFDLPIDLKFLKSQTNFKTCSLIESINSEPLLSNKIVLPPLISATPLRGPPSFSC